METTASIKKIYKDHFPRRFEYDIRKYIAASEVQIIIKKALSYKLSDIDYKWLFDNGQHNSDIYPHLYWLCAIYIHPLTIGRYVLGQCEKLQKNLNRA